MIRQQLDAVDLQLLSLLQKDGRITNVELARQVGLSPPTVLERVRKLEEGKIVRGYAALVEPKRVGLDLVAFVLVTLERHTSRLIQSFQRSIMNLPEVLECYHLAGEGDFLLKMVERDISAYRDFLIERLTVLQGVRRVRTLIVFDTLKQCNQLPLPSVTKEK